MTVLLLTRLLLRRRVRRLIGQAAELHSPSECTIGRIERVGWIGVEITDHADESVLHFWSDMIRIEWGEGVTRRLRLKRKAWRERLERHAQNRDDEEEAPPIPDWVRELEERVAASANGDGRDDGPRRQGEEP